MSPESKLELHTYSAVLLCCLERSSDHEISINGLSMAQVSASRTSLLLDNLKFLLCLIAGIMSKIQLLFSHRLFFLCLIYLLYIFLFSSAKFDTIKSKSEIFKDNCYVVDKSSCYFEPVVP